MAVTAPVSYTHLLKQHLEHPFRSVSNFDLQVSYQLERYIASATDNDFITIATDFNNPQRYLGPNGLDRKHQISFCLLYTSVGNYDAPSLELAHYDMC